MNKVEIIQQICELRRDFLDLQRASVIDGRPRTYWQGNVMTERETAIYAGGVSDAYGSARAKVEGMLRRIAKSEDPSSNDAHKR